MHDHQFPHAALQERSRRVAQGDRVQRAVRLANFESGRLARLNFIEDAIVRVPQRRQNDARKAVAVFAHDIDAGFQSGRLRLAQQGGRFGAMLGVGRVQRVEQQQVAQVKNAGADLLEIQPGPVPERIGPAMMKESAMTVALFGHDIGVGSRRERSGLKVARIDAMLPAIFEDDPAQIVIAHQSRRQQRKRHFQPG